MTDQSKLQIEDRQTLPAEDSQDEGIYEYVEIEEEEEEPTTLAVRPPEAPTGILRFLPRSRRTRVTLALIAIAIMVVLAFFAPPEGDSNNVSGDQPEVPTIVATNQTEAYPVNRSIDFKGVHITIEQVMIATKFSDDRKRAGAYTARVQVQTKNSGQSLVGLDYSTLVRLILPDNSVVDPKYITLKPVEMAGSSQEGYLDFPLPAQYPAASLSLRFGDTLVVSFSS